MIIQETDCIGKCFLRKAPPLRRQMQEQFFPHATENTQDSGDHGIDKLVEAHCYGIGRGGAIFEQSCSSWNRLKCITICFNCYVIAQQLPRAPIMVLTCSFASWMTQWPCCRPETLCLPLVLTYPEQNLLTDSWMMIISKSFCVDRSM